MDRPPKRKDRTPDPTSLELRAKGLCGAKRSRRNEDGEILYCQQTAGRGTDHPGVGRCKHHGGCTPSGVKSAQEEQAYMEVERFGLARNISPAQALLEEVHRSAGTVAYLDFVVQQLEQDELKQYTTDGEGRTWVKPAVWVEMYARERRHLVQACEAAIRCGVAQAMVQLAQEQGQLLATAIRGILGDLGVADRPEAPEIVRRHLAAVAGGGG